MPECRASAGAQWRCVRPREGICQHFLAAEDATQPSNSAKRNQRAVGFIGFRARSEQRWLEASHLASLRCAGCGWRLACARGGGRGRLACARGGGALLGTEVAGSEPLASLRDQRRATRTSRARAMATTMATVPSTPLHCAHPTRPAPWRKQEWQTATFFTSPPVSSQQSAQTRAWQVAQGPAAGAWQ